MRRTEIAIAAAGGSFERQGLRVRINTGALVSQDRGVVRWPATASGAEVDADMEFDAEWTGRWWECRADGYGRRSWKGEAGGYGNGSIFVHSRDGVTIVNELQNTKITGPQGPVHR